MAAPHKETDADVFMITAGSREKVRRFKSGSYVCSCGKLSCRHIEALKRELGVTENDVKAALPVPSSRDFGAEKVTSE